MNAKPLMLENEKEEAVLAQPVTAPAFTEQPMMVVGGLPMAANKAEPSRLRPIAEMKAIEVPLSYVFAATEPALWATRPLRTGCA